MVAARATGKEQRPLPCGSHSRRRAKQIDRAVFPTAQCARRMCPATGTTPISLSRNALRPTKPGFMLAAGSRLTPLVPALDSPKLSTPTVLVRCRISYPAPRGSHRHGVLFAATVHECMYLPSLTSLRTIPSPFSVVVAKEPHPTAEEAMNQQAMYSTDREHRTQPVSSGPSELHLSSFNAFPQSCRHGPSGLKRGMSYREPQTNYHKFNHRGSRRQH